MYAIDLMVKEHSDIQKMIGGMHKLCCRILENDADVCDEKAVLSAETIQHFYNFIDFTRNYADHHHHGKEEKILFPVMTANLGTMAENLVTHGMLVEHDLGRSHIRALETLLKLYQENPKTEHKLSIITEAMGYSNLLLLHTEKENSVVYTFAERMLSQELKDKIDSDCRSFEEEQAKLGVQEKYLKMMDDFTASTSDSISA